MATRKTVSNHAGPPDEAFEGLDAWAAQVAECLTPAELKLLVGMYRKIAANCRVSDDNRRLARKQALALKKKIVQYP